MIFEVPIDHFPAAVAQISRGVRENKPLRLSTVSLQCKEVNAAVAPSTPSVCRAQFNFSAEVQKSVPKVRASIPPLKRALTSPALTVHHLNLNAVRKGSTPSSQASRTNSISDLLRGDLLKMPARLLSNAVSLHQLA